MTIHAAARTAMAAAGQQIEQAAQRVSRAATVDPAQGDALDLSQEMVGLPAAKTAFQTATRLARAAEGIDKHALDLLA